MNVKISHADFAVGMQNGTVGCLLGTPYQFVKGARGPLFILLTMLYMVAPLIILPLWAYHEGNWWLLAGIAVSYLASGSAGKASRTVYVFGCYSIGFWIHNGCSIHHYTTFYFCCALWGYMTYQLADTVQMSFARQSIISSSKVFDDAISQNRLRIVQLDSSQQAILTSEDISLALTENLLELKPFLTLLVFSNILLEALTYLFGLFTGLIGVAITHVKGIENLTSQKGRLNYAPTEKGFGRFRSADARILRGK